MDCIIVLGFELDNGKMTSILESRLDEAIKLYKENPTKIVVSGGNSKGGITEAEVMEKYVIDNGVGKDEIIKEEKSTNTIGNAFYIKKDIIEPNNWKSITIVTSDFHIERTKFTFNKVLGNGYDIDVIGTKVENISPREKEIIELEGTFMEITKTVFENVKSGDDSAVENVIEKIKLLIKGDI